MSELLLPAGNIESFYAAISNGADAVYLGLNKYSARAYADNFTLDNLQELTNFAHLRNVKIYVTINTIIYDSELKDVYKDIDKLAEIGVDGIIVQDLAVLNYIVSNYKTLVAHASTQMGVDDVNAAKIVKKLGAKRIVFARETPLETIKKVKEEVDIEAEAFIHGALCVSYSGNCLMSSMIGERSGNRGRCAGCCRKPYKLIDLGNQNKELFNGYILSMKDLNVSSNVKDMSFIDSLKIEGRMKEPNYVANVARSYRQILDGEKVDQEVFLKIFNRTYTKGFINNESSLNITNIEKPNNYGNLIGSIVKQVKDKIWISLNKELNKGDQIRIETSNIFKEISVPVLKMFDFNGNEIFASNKYVVTYCKDRVKEGAKVYKTKDIKMINLAEENCGKKEYKKLPLNLSFEASEKNVMKLTVKFENISFDIFSNSTIERAKTIPTTEENIKSQLSKLNDTPYAINELRISLGKNLFISLKELNELRRNAVEKLNSLRLQHNTIKGTYNRVFPKNKAYIYPEITVEVSNDEQFEAAKSEGVTHIYYHNVVRRNNAIYTEQNNEILVGGLGGIEAYKGKKIITDTSLNVVNSDSVAILSSLGVERITLSEEISKEDIQNLIANYEAKYGTSPNLELKVYGRTKIMHSKYCPLKRLNMCGLCKKSTYALKDEFAVFPIKNNDDCTMTIFNSKVTNIMDKIDDLKGINYFRLSFTDETSSEVKNTIRTFKEHLKNKNAPISFDASTQTRGHFLKKIL